MDLETQKKIEESIAEAAAGVQAMRDSVKTVEQNMDGLDKDKWNKAGEDASAALEAVQKMQAADEAKGKAEDAFQERLDRLEKSIAKGIKGGNGAEGETSAYHKSLNPIIRKEGDARLDIDENKKNVEEMCKLYLPHLDDAGMAKAIDLTTKTLMTGSGPDGGYWVPVERIATMIQQIFETSPMRQLASTITTATNAIKLAIDDQEFTATWGNELSVPVNNDTPQIGELDIAIHNLFARAPITENMLEDSTIDIVGWITDKAVDKFSRTENTAFVRGNGTNKPRGFLTYPAADDPDVYQRGAIGQVPTLAASATFDMEADDFFNLQNHIKEPYQAGASWLLKRRTWFRIATLKDGQDQYLLRFGDQFANSVRTMVLGAPVVFADDMDAPGDNTFPVAYGNFRAAYTIVDRVGMGILVDPYSEDPLIRYRFRKRLGGAVTNYEAIKLMRTRSS